MEEHLHKVEEDNSVVMVNVYSDAVAVNNVSVVLKVIFRDNDYSVMVHENVTLVIVIKDVVDRTINAKNDNSAVVNVIMGMATNTIKEDEHMIIMVFGLEIIINHMFVNMVVVEVVNDSIPLNRFVYYYTVNVIMTNFIKIR